MGELALAEEIDPSCLDRTLRLRLLAPDIVEAILDERLRSEVGLAEIMRPIPAEWGEQRGCWKSGRNLSETYFHDERKDE
jgi:hypothetical protein